MELTNQENMESNKREEDFYLRYHAGQRGRCGLEYLEFEVFHGGKLRYVNKSSYDRDFLCREFYVGPGVVEEMKQMVYRARLIELDDSQWCEPFHRRDSGIQELEVKIGCHHVCFATTEICKFDIQKSADPLGLEAFYHLSCDLKALVMTLISCHFTERPFG